jgi:hypothetical protein
MSLGWVPAGIDAGLRGFRTALPGAGLNHPDERRVDRDDSQNPDLDE